MGALSSFFLFLANGYLWSLLLLLHYHYHHDIIMWNKLKLLLLLHWILLMKFNLI
jgi:hypothetical protein